jgi:hypothetical protein
VRSTAAPYTESRLTRSVANERVGFPVVEQCITPRILFYTRFYRLVSVITNYRILAVAVPAVFSKERS